MKKIVIIVAVLFILSLFSCEYLLSPMRGRENPDDQYCPVGGFSVVATGPNSVRISFQTPDSWDEEGEPGALWILYRAETEVDSVDDVEDGNASEYFSSRWGELSNWYDGSQFSYDQPLNDNPDVNNTYYFSAFWTYDDDIDTDRLGEYEWFGPVSDTAVFQTQTMSLYPDLDGYVSDGMGFGFSSMYTSMYFGSGYNYISLLRYSDESIPPSIDTAFLKLYCSYSPTGGGTADVGLIQQSWDDSIIYSTAQSGEFVDGGSINSSIPSSLGTYDEISLDVTELLQRWSDEGGRYGLRIQSSDIYDIGVFTQDTADSSYWPILDITYYGDGDE